jgi:LPS sulfotransferase NodH
MPLAYLVCATQRSGSTLLCKALTATGVAGRPQEYFEARPGTGRPPAPSDYGIELAVEPAPAPPYSSLAEIDDYADHVRRTLELGTTPNGVFGAKLMYSQLADLAAHAGSEAPGVFEELLGRAPSYVRVTRTDRVSQAVSLWTALQTQAWAAAHKSPEDVARYDFAAIRKLAAWVDDQEGGWDGFFGQHAIEPLALTYDEIAGDLKQAVRRVLVHLGLDPTPADSVEPPMERQADGRSQEWVDRYHRDSREVIV